MKIFLDTANLEEIKNAASMGVIDGITTNPSLIARERVDFKEQIKKIVEIVDGDISAEVISTSYDEMLSEAQKLARIHKNIVVKIPMTENGLKAIKTLSRKGIRVNTTLVFSVSQALLAAKAGSYLVSPFIGRIDDINMDGMQLIRDLRNVFDNFEIKAKILAASIRHPFHVHECAKAGADIVTIPFNVLQKMVKHPLTDIGLQKFLNDAQKAGLKV